MGRAPATRDTGHMQATIPPGVARLFRRSRRTCLPDNSPARGRSAAVWACVRSDRFRAGPLRFGLPPASYPIEDPHEREEARCQARDQGQGEDRQGPCRSPQATGQARCAAAKPAHGKPSARHTPAPAKPAKGGKPEVPAKPAAHPARTAAHPVKARPSRPQARPPARQGQAQRQGGQRPGPEARRAGRRRFCRHRRRARGRGGGRGRRGRQGRKGQAAAHEGRRAPRNAR